MADLEFYHNKGEQDRANGIYDPPYSLLDDLLTWSDSGMDEMYAANDAYNKGWNNTNNQLS